MKDKQESLNSMFNQKNEQKIPEIMIKLIQPFSGLPFLDSLAPAVADFSVVRLFPALFPWQLENFLLCGSLCVWEPLYLSLSLCVCSVVCGVYCALPRLPLLISEQPSLTVLRGFIFLLRWSPQAPFLISPSPPSSLSPPFPSLFSRLFPTFLAQPWAGEPSWVPFLIK